MKKFLFTLMMLMSFSFAANALDYNTARSEALFLTDKMAHELNLNDMQYEQAYQINLDYLMKMDCSDDAYSNYLVQRNADIRYILYDWQYDIFSAADYFFRPIGWHLGRWYFPIYSHYDRGYFYYHRPACYLTYRGEHAWYSVGHSWYNGRRPEWNGGLRGRDRFYVEPTPGRNGFRIGGTINFGKHNNGRGPAMNDRNIGRFNNNDHKIGRFNNNDRNIGRFNNTDSNNGRFNNNDRNIGRFNNNDRNIGRFNNTDSNNGRINNNDRFNNTERPTFNRSDNNSSRGNSSFQRQSSTRSTVNRPTTIDGNRGGGTFNLTPANGGSRGSRR